eukprot:TRINITY_DN1587_c0_g2_i5.p1 TRINITY_DN1587_c0_g2~~TRINITY_DN1587_c0_g2_i5.p1  ORF type:complete len:207 (+),score=3.44 TRINITY_DN1587_c0_g2_i5:213-833(+)
MRVASESLVLASESLVLVIESLVLASESLVLDSESLMLAGESLEVTGESLAVAGEPQVRALIRVHDAAHQADARPHDGAGVSPRGACNVAEDPRTKGARCYDRIILHRKVCERGGRGRIRIRDRVPGLRFLHGDGCCVQRKQHKTITFSDVSRQQRQHSNGADSKCNTQPALLQQPAASGPCRRQSCKAGCLKMILCMYMYTYTCL